MLAALTCLAWAFLLIAWGGFWRADQRLGTAPPPRQWPEIVTVIPARNEAATIGDVVRAHRATTYPGKAQVIVVDDHSNDGTGRIAAEAGAEVFPADPLPTGWSGKLWALSNGLDHADRVAPEATWVLLTDADILHDPETLGALVRKGEAEGRALVSLMARLDARGLWGALLIPAFVFFFQKLYPFPWVNRPGFPLAGAAGGCILIRRDALRGIGGVESLKDALIDDCTLAARVKRWDGGQAIWLGLADREVVSLRDNRAFQSIWTMVRRTAFTQLRHSWLLLAGAVAGMAFLYLGPWIAVLGGIGMGAPISIVLGLLAVGLMSLAYWPTVRRYGFRSSWALTLPAAAVLYTAMTVASALAHLRGRGGAWKGRTYP